MRGSLTVAGVLLATVSFGLPAAAARPDSASPPSWNQVSSPDVGTGGTNTLAAVSCSSGAHCLAVGSDSGATGGNHGDVILRRTGGTWQTVTTSHTAGGWALTGVSCPTSSWCMSVGSDDPHPDKGFSPAAESVKNGKEHEALTGLPKTTGDDDVLNAVSCRKSTICFAVGADVINDHSIGPLVERWNGHRWSKQTAPDPGKGPDNAGVDGSSLSDVTCISKDSCIAVGSTQTVTGKTSLGADVISGYTFALHYNGKTWHSIKPKNPLAYHPPGKVAKQRVSLSSVACPSATKCFATGDSMVANLDTHGFIERWNGHKWSVAYKAPSPQLELAAIGCGSKSDCDVVTHDGHAGDITPVAKYEHILGWSGHGWHGEAINPPASSLLDALACGSAATCFAVGSSMPTDITTVTLILSKQP